MTSFVPNAASITRKWYVLDAANKPLGRIAAQASILLRGKHKPIFMPHVDCGDHVIIVNCAKVILTGNKKTQKKRFKHTGYIGHVKTIDYEKLMSKNPEKAMQYAVKGMIHNCTLGRKQFLRLCTFANDSHNHEAQTPELFTNFAKKIKSSGGK